MRSKLILGWIWKSKKGGLPCSLGLDLYGILSILFENSIILGSRTVSKED